ncbi:MAG: DUF5004 domain-containing protein [Ginsengibacter sp.]
MVKYFTYLNLVLVLSSCSFSAFKKEKSLYGSWRLQDVQSNIEKGSDFEKLADSKQAVQDGSMLSFYADGSYTLIKGNGFYANGKWKADKNNTEIDLQNLEAKSENSKIKLELNPQNKQVLYITTQDNIISKYIKETEPLTIFQDDPFYVSNNQWRIRSDVPENKKELTARFCNYCKHVALILKAAKERKQDVVYFDFSLGPIQIYRNAIGVHPYNIVPKSWKDYFYDEAQASTAYLKYQNYLATSHYRGASSGNWIDDDYNILLGVYSGLSKSE